MTDFARQRTLGFKLAGRCKFAVAAVLMSAVLTACGGDSDSPAAQAAPGAAQSSSGAAPSSQGAAASSPGSAPSGSDATVVAGGVAAARGAVTLSWTPPTQNNDGTALRLTGYRIYWSQTRDHFTNSVTVTNPGLTRYVVEQLTPATWYFVATALSGETESEFSNVFSIRVQ